MKKLLKWILQHMDSSDTIVDPDFFSPERKENRRAMYKFLADGEVSKSLIKPTECDSRIP
jgi:hypothetical protein